MAAALAVAVTLWLSAPALVNVTDGGEKVTFPATAGSFLLRGHIPLIAGELPEVAETGDNRSSKTAMELTVPVAVPNGMRGGVPNGVSSGVPPGTRT